MRLKEMKETVNKSGRAAGWGFGESVWQAEVVDCSRKWLRASMQQLIEEEQWEMRQLLQRGEKQEKRGDHIAQVTRHLTEVLFLIYIYIYIYIYIHFYMRLVVVYCAGTYTLHYIWTLFSACMPLHFLSCSYSILTINSGHSSFFYCCICIETVDNKEEKRKDSSQKRR